MKRRYARPIIAAIVLLHLAGMVALSRVRPIDGDEGYYAAAARLVSEGRALYTDFFYPQMPLLPPLYAAAGQLIGTSLLDLRLVSVALASVSLLLWGLLLARGWPNRPGLLAVGLLLMALDPYLLSWQVTIKTFAMANLGVFAALWALDRAMAGGRWFWPLLAGAACGLAVGVRALYAPWALATILTAAVVVWRRPQGRRPALFLVGLSGAGMLLVLAPVIFKLATDPDRFLFNNLTYHRLRYSPFAAGPGWERPLAAVSMLGRALLASPYQVLLVLLAVWGGRRLRGDAAAQLRPVAAVAAVGLVTYGVTCLFPNPVYEQYFAAPLVPLLAPLVAAGLLDLMTRYRRSGRIGMGLVALAALLAVVDLQVRRTGMIDDEVWQPSHLERVTRAIKARTVPEDYVLSFWSGYASESGCRFVPGMENHFAVGVSEKISLEEKIRYHVAGKELLLLTVTRRDPAVIVLGAWNHEVESTVPQEHLLVFVQELSRGYESVQDLGGVKILTPRAVPLPRAAPAQPDSARNR